MAKKQYDLEDYLAKRPQRELTDPFTGEVFQPSARNHYEDNDGKPFAPPLDLPRPTLRQRVENLTRRDPDILSRYVDQYGGDEGYEMEVPDDAEAPLTTSEQNYIDTIASDLAERAPLPDDGMPRQHSGNSEVPAEGKPAAPAEPAPPASQPAALQPPQTHVPTR